MAGIQKFVQGFVASMWSLLQYGQYFKGAPSVGHKMAGIVVLGQYVVVQRINAVVVSYVLLQVFVVAIIVTIVVMCVCGWCFFIFFHF